MKAFLTRVFRWEYIWLFLIVITFLVMHLVVIDNVTELILDENHYVKDARVIIHEQDTHIKEHPPLAKLIIAGGIIAFGENPQGWRFFPIIFGTVSVFLFFFICRRLGLSPGTASLATALLAFENMNFTQAGVAMLDVFFVTFMMAVFLLYLSRRYVTAGIAVGLSALAKLTGLLALPVTGIHWLFSGKKRPWLFALTIVAAPVAFLAIMPLLDFLIVRDWANVTAPWDRLQTMMNLTGSLTFGNSTHDALSRPWEWLIFYRPMAYWYNPHYTAAISPSVWALAIPTVIYMVVRAVRGNNAALFGVAWFVGTYLVWIPASLITDRISFVFYFYPTIGALCLGLGMMLTQLIGYFRRKRPVPARVEEMAVGEAAVEPPLVKQKETPMDIATPVFEAPEPGRSGWPVLGGILRFYHRRPGVLRWAALALVVLALLVHVISFIILAPVFPISYDFLIPK